MGTYEIYADIGQSYGIQVRQARECPLIDAQHVSSTQIRRLLAEGKIHRAKDYLSYPYTLEGRVVHGDHLGKTIGFPTANIALNSKDKVVPMRGVYSVHVFVKNIQYLGMAYIGRRPTLLSDGEQRIEVNIFDFDKDIYGKQIRIEFIRFIRPDSRFKSLNELKQRLSMDRALILSVG